MINLFKIVKLKRDDKQKKGIRRSNGGQLSPLHACAINIYFFTKELTL